MQMYNATVEVATKKLNVDTVMEALAAFHPAVGMSDRGWVSATLTLPAESLAQAAATAAAVVASACGADPLAAEVMTEVEFDARQGFVPLPELVSVTEAAELLGVSRQRVLQRISDHTLPATRVGRDWVMPRSAVTK